MKGQDGDKDRGQGLDGDLDVERIEQLPEEPPLFPGLLPDPGHDPLFEKGGRLHLAETPQELLRAPEVREGAAAPLARGQMRFDALFLFRGKEILLIGRKQIVDLFAGHRKSPHTFSRLSFRAFRARKRRDRTVPSGSFSITPISS